MASALKHFFNRERVETIAAQLQKAWPRFQRERFVAATRGIEKLELLKRAKLISEAMAEVLPRDFPATAQILIRSLGPELDPHKDVLGQGMGAFVYMPHVMFVAERGLEHFDAAMKLQYELTRRFSAESSIRYFLVREQERTLKVLRKWAKDLNQHVRRLVSEGTRPRLPWAMRLREFQRDPAPVLALLELLKDDPAEYVRRSVANNLNDIGKDHPKLLIDTCRRWMVGATPEREKLIRHALRSAVKRGDAAALKVLGFGGAVNWRVRATVAPRQVRIGASFELALTLRSHSRRTERAVVDAAIHFVKLNGATRPKVFKLKALHLKPGESVVLEKRLSLRQMTTRRHHPGRHAVDVLINGASQRVAEFEVIL
jgi:3-methyladenine DNA glycosylase AlkC